jgi:hypothetical protein
VPSTNAHGEAASPKRPLTGAAADQARRGAERRQAAEAHLATFEALAECIVQVLGVDLIRAKLGKAKALKVFKLAGLYVQNISAGWEATDPVNRQMSRSHPDAGYDMDPAHDPRVTQAVLTDRLPAEQVNQIQREVAREYAAKRAAAHARTRDGTADMGVPGVLYDGGVPVQRSGPGNVADGQVWDAETHTLRAAPRRDLWHDLDHQPGYMDRASPGIGSSGMPAPVPGAALPGASVTECDHDAEAGKFCSACGAPLAPAGVAG